MENIFKNQLEKELERNVTQQTEITDQIDIIKTVQDNIKSIAEQPERPHSFFQVNSLAYVPATIIHTGEQYVALGNVGQILMTTQETCAFLQRKIDCLNTCLDSFKFENSQLQKRQELFFPDYNEIPEAVTDMPAEIPTDFGTAYKLGTGLFDIKEYDESTEYVRKPVKSTKKWDESEAKKNNEIKDDDWYMSRFEELDREENSADNESTSHKAESSGEDETVLEKVKTIIKECGLYESLSKDLDIKKFCDQATEESTSDAGSFLNSIIIKALQSESPNVLKYCEEDLAKDFEENVNVSKNDLQLSNYLDSIDDL